VWLTGLSGSGKTTLARALRGRLAASGPAEILDGDEIRHSLCRDLGYSKTDRDANIFRIGFVARLLARNGVVTIVSAVSPYREARNEVRREAAGDGTPFVEVFLNPSLEVLVQRDVKGLYEKALSGELPHFTGVSDPYEPPESPDLLVRTDEESVDVSLHRIVRLLERRRLLDQRADTTNVRVTHIADPPPRPSPASAKRGIEPNRH
jgi:adenylylsulfate kinase